MSNDKLDYVIGQLNDRAKTRTQLQAIAESTNLSRRTLVRIMKKETTPKLQTLDGLHQYLKSVSRKKVL